MKYFWIVYIIGSLSLFSCRTRYVTPQMYGGIADGKTDCTMAMREMLSDMKKRGIYTAIFKEGNYVLSDSIRITFPCRLIGKDATVVTNDSLLTRFAFFFNYQEKSKSSKKKRTEISLNFKIHGIPVSFRDVSNVYMHDCMVGTYTGENINGTNTNFWYAIDCNRLENAVFKNIKIDQPINYKKNSFNSADGFHITGLCRNINIESCYGHAGDDFIALNASEIVSGDIDNIRISNCNIGSDTISKNGIRIYGMSNNKRLTISNVTIENCNIDCINSPCVYITNNANTSFNNTCYSINVENLVIKNCKFKCPQYELATNDYPSSIRFAGTNAKNIIFKNIDIEANADSLSYFVNFFEKCKISNLRIEKCHFTGLNAYKYIKIGRNDSSSIEMTDISIQGYKSQSPSCDFIDNRVRIYTKGSGKKLTISTAP